MIVSISSNILATKFFDSIIMRRSDKTKVAKEECYDAKKINK